MSLTILNERIINMKVCYQRSDTSCKDFVFNTIDEVLDYWNNIDKAREDAFCGNQKDCPWCLYIEDEITFHIYIKRYIWHSRMERGQI